MPPATSSASDIGIVVLTHGTEGVYAPLVASMLEQGAAPESIVIVHNSTSNDGPVVQPPAPGVRVIHNGRNLGFAGGMNAGIRHQLARGVTNVLLLTHEVRVRDGALAALREAATATPRFGILGPALRFPDSERVFSFGGRRMRSGAVEHIMDAASASPEGIVTCDWIDGAAMLIRADALQRVGLMDDRFFMYFEETDLCLRVQRAGWEIGVVLAAVAEQAPGGTRRPGAFAYLMSRNGTEYARRASGAYGVVSAFWRTLHDSSGHVGCVVRRRTPAEQRATSRATLEAMWLGMLDFGRRRWGPPPARLTGLGDAVGTGAS